jgi:hypothetical protein
MEQYIQTERLFSLYQAVKALDHYGLIYNELVKKKSDGTNKYREETPVLSYYVLTAGLLFGANNFIEWTIHNNNHTLDFRKIPTSITRYCDLIERLYNTPQLMSAMNEITKKWDTMKIQGSTRVDPAIMRMTALEL